MRVLAVHLDGVASRGQRTLTAELVTAQWAHDASSWSDDEHVRALATCREAQPLVACSLWLRMSVALDVLPCNGLALVAGTESKHGVPVPQPRTGNTWSAAYSRARSRTAVQAR